MTNFNFFYSNHLRSESTRWLLLMLIILFFSACSGGANGSSAQSTNINRETIPTSTPLTDDNNTNDILLPATSTLEPTVTQAPSEEPIEVLETPELGIDKMIREAREKLLGGIWVLSSFSGLNPDNQISTDDLKDYTLVFNEDGTFYFSANCVRGSGSYSTDSSYTLSLDLEFPNEENNSNLPFYQFLDALAQVERKDFSDDDQILDLRGTKDLTFERMETPLEESVIVESKIGIEPEQISLDTQGLFSSWTAYKISATNYTRDFISGIPSLPEHIIITFDGTDPFIRQPTDAFMYIIPVSAYKELWEANGDTCVTKTLDNLSVRLSGEIAIGIVVMPFEEVMGINGFTDNVNRVRDNGYSVVKPFAPDLETVTNDELRYAYQGLTDDGQYFVAFFVPAVGEDFRFQTEDKLAELVNSLTIDGISGPNQNPVVEKLWQLQRIVYSDGTVTEVSDPEAYTFQINREGIFNYMADCHNGSGEYRSFNPQAGAVTGGLWAWNTSAIQGECELTPLSQQFIDSFGENALNYYIMEEGRMILHNGSTLSDSDFLLYFNNGGDVSQP